MKPSIAIDMDDTVADTLSRHIEWHIGIANQSSLLPTTWLPVLPRRAKYKVQKEPMAYSGVSQHQPESGIGPRFSALRLH